MKMDKFGKKELAVAHTAIYTTDQMAKTMKDQRRQFINELKELKKWFEEEHFVPQRYLDKMDKLIKNYGG